MVRTKKTGQKGLLLIHQEKQESIALVRQTYQLTKDEALRLKADAMQESLNKSINRHQRRCARDKRTADRKKKRAAYINALKSSIEESLAEESVTDTESDSEIFGNLEKAKDTDSDDNDNAGGGMGGNLPDEVKV